MKNIKRFTILSLIVFVMALFTAIISQFTLTAHAIGMHNFYDGYLIDEINFPDPVFREVLKGWDINGDNFLSHSEFEYEENAQGDRPFKMDNRGIYDLTGINLFGASIRLHARNNHLTELDYVRTKGSQAEVYLGGQTRTIAVYGNTVDMSQFGDVKRMKNLSGGTLDGTILTLDENATNITYTYDTKYLDYDSDGKEMQGYDMDVVLTIDNEAASLVAINARNFPDKNFRTFVGDFDTDDDGKLSPSELAAVTTVDVSKSEGAADSNKITSLKGIEYFTALTSLACDNNLLTTLDLESNTLLTDLSCENNGIKIISPSNLDYVWFTLYTPKYQKVTPVSGGSVDDNGLLYLSEGSTEFVYTYDTGLTGKTMTVTMNVNEQTLVCLKEKLWLKDGQYAVTGDDISLYTGSGAPTDNYAYLKDGVLTLKNYFTTPDAYKDYGILIWGDLTICLIGNNDVRGGMRCDGGALNVINGGTTKDDAGQLNVFEDCYGFGLSVEGDLLIDNVTVRARNSNSLDGYDGCVWSRNGNLTIKNGANVIFPNGGRNALNANGDILIENSTVTVTQQLGDETIKTSTGSVTIIGSTVNTAGTTINSGDAISCADVVTISGSTVTVSYAYKSGIYGKKGIVIDEQSNVTIVEADNSAIYSSGSVTLDESTLLVTNASDHGIHGTTVDIKNSSYTIPNKIGDQPIKTTEGALTITDSTLDFAGSSSGDAISCTDTIMFSNSTITVGYAYKSGIYGKNAITIDEGSEVTITETGNSAFYTNGDVTVENSTITIGKTAQDFIYSGKSIYLTDSTFTGVETNRRGFDADQKIHVSGSKVTVDNGTSQHIFRAQGDALILENSEAWIKYSKQQVLRAENGLQIIGTTLTIDECDNHAIIVKKGGAQIEDSTILIKNAETQTGIQVEGEGASSMTNSTFTVEKSMYGVRFDDDFTLSADSTLTVALPLDGVDRALTVYGDFNNYAAFVGGVWTENTGKVINMEGGSVTGNVYGDIQKGDILLDIASSVEQYVIMSATGEVIFPVGVPVNIVNGEYSTALVGGFRITDNGIVLESGSTVKEFVIPQDFTVAIYIENVHTLVAVPADGENLAYLEIPVGGSVNDGTSDILGRVILYSDGSISIPRAITVENGVISGQGASSMTVEKGETITVIADNAPEGKVFSGWLVNGETVSIENTYTFEVTTDVTLTAQYSVVILTYTIIVENGTASDGNTSIVVNENDSVTVTANSAPDGKQFKGWSINGEIVSTDENYTFNATADTTITAVYEDVSTNPPVNPPDENPDGLSGGAIVGIVIGSVLVVGIGGFAIFWFVIKKKKFADLIAVFKKK